MCKLLAEGSMVERDVLPPLIVIEGKQKSAGTAVLFDKSGLAALMRPPEQPVPVVAFEKLFTPDSPATQPFELYVRQFGSDETIAQRLLAQIQAWKAAISSTNEMHIRAYPKDFDYKLLENEILLEKQWTKLVIVWRAHV